VCVCACVVNVTFFLAHAVDFDDRQNLDDAVISLGGEGDSLDKIGFVKRVNSASLVENRSRRLDWSSTRCNSDVSWNPVQSRAISSGISKSLFHGSSRIRLVSPTTENVHISLPRLTSHHSSSDEEWFEVIDDDEIAEIEPDMETVETVQSTKEDARKSISISRRLSKKEQEVDGLSGSKSKWQTLLKSVRKKRKEEKEDDLKGSWETIDLHGGKTKDGDRVKEKRPPDRARCCILQ